jgi:hypothetical protein
MYCDHGVETWDSDEETAPARPSLLAVARGVNLDGLSPPRNPARGTGSHARHPSASEPRDRPSSEVIKGDASPPALKPVGALK